MPVSVFREKFNIPPNLNSTFFFGWSSSFENELPLEEEPTAKVLDIVQNYESFVQTMNGFIKRSGEDEVKALKLKFFIRPYKISPTFPNKKKYAECMG